MFSSRSLPPASPSAPVTARERLISRAITACVVFAAAVATVRPVLSSTPWMLFLEDDFFYYLKVAQNLAHGNGSTFNGVVATNGYHPLWLLVLTAACAVSIAPKFLLGFVAAVTFVSSVSIYLLTRRLVLLSGTGLLPACGLAAYATVYSMHVLFGGMEIVLTIPLVLLVVLLARQPELWEPSTSAHITKQFAVVGLAISAMVLSRLDTALMAALLGLGVLSQRELRQRLRPPALLGLAVGLLPLVLYFASNLWIFDMLLPVSGEAKQLKTNLLPSPVPWRSVLDRPASQLVNFVPILAAIGLLVFRGRNPRSTERAVYLPVLVFPFLYLLLLSVLSDWQLWGWYLYPFRTAFCVSLAVLCTVPVFESMIPNRVITALLLIFAVVHLTSAVWRVAGRETIYDAAQDLAGFARTHPGTYAMGDRSGMVAWLMPDPVIQTEGLVMDKAFLGSIRSREGLLPVLARYNVRYYVGTTQQMSPGCFRAAEPFQAGPASPHMLAELCQAPVAVFHHGDWYNLVFDLAAR